MCVNSGLDKEAGLSVSTAGSAISVDKEEQSGA